eukprot:COSAG02_NODE_31847_length_526_cov_1.000000_1_plen_77_part_10
MEREDREAQQRRRRQQRQRGDQQQQQRQRALTERHYNTEWATTFRTIRSRHPSAPSTRAALTDTATWGGHETPTRPS